MTEVLPKHVLLVKLLKMTSSPNDGEALTAVRKANELLASAGWDWDRLMSGKIVVVEDPFGAIGTPKSGRGEAAPPTPATQPPRPFQQAPRPAPAPPPKPAPKATTWPLGQMPNKFAAFCYCCGVEVLTGKGFIFKASDYSHGPSHWSVACTPCNMTALVANFAAPHVRVRRKANVSDLA